jgi:hypothetical protein
LDDRAGLATGSSHSPELSLWMGNRPVFLFFSLAAFQETFCYFYDSSTTGFLKS